MVISQQSIFYNNMYTCTIIQGSNAFRKIDLSATEGNENILP